MRVWPALILAPLFALASITFGYALVPAACGASQWMLHAAILVPLALSLAATALALADMKRQHEKFLPLVATWTGAFFSLVIAAQWATQLFVSPCMN